MLLLSRFVYGCLDHVPCTVPKIELLRAAEAGYFTDQMLTKTLKVISQIHINTNNKLLHTMQFEFTFAERCY